MSEAPATEQDVRKPSPRPGQLLAAARAAKGMTVAEAALQLKLSASQVTALEADDYSKLPGPVFIRGFVRNYARLLDLDGEALIDAMDLPHAPAPASAAVPVSRNIPFPAKRAPSWLPYALGLLALVVAALVFEFMISGPQQAVVVTMPTPASTQAPVPRPEPAAREAWVPGQISAPASPVSAVTADAPPAAPVAVEVAGATVAPSSRQSGMSEAHFVFKGTSWVEVRDRNERVLFSQLNPGGSERRVAGWPPFNVVVGNASEVRLTYNGKPFDLKPHTRVEVARFILE
jgi:cytoskeleton protein RodZ